MKRVTITFDYEGSWGMPHAVEYDLGATTERLLNVLQRHNARAVFFVTGRLIEEYPQIIKRLHELGHEIGLHGYSHEHMHDLNSRQIAALQANLSNSSRLLQGLGIPAAVGFRAPYLMGPKFYDPAVYSSLYDIGMRWVSNREIRMPEELFRPDRLPYGGSLLRWLPLRRLLLLMLNFRLVTRDTVVSGPWLVAAIRWVLTGAAPFRRPEGLVEYPLTSPLDCDLFDFVTPQTQSGQASLGFATRTIITCFEQSGEYFNINCHDWIMGSADRIQVLDDVLALVATRPGVGFWLPGRDGGSL